MTNAGTRKAPALRIDEPDRAASGGLLDLALLDAARAGVDMRDGAGDLRVDALEVRHRPLLRLVVRVADRVPDERTLAAHFTDHRHRSSSFPAGACAAAS